MRVAIIPERNLGDYDDIAVGSIKLEIVKTRECRIEPIVDKVAKRLLGIDQRDCRVALSWGIVGWQDDRRLE